MIKYFKLTDQNLVPATFEHGNIILAQISNNQERQQIVPLLPLTKNDIASSLDPNEIGHVEFNDAYRSLFIKITENTNSKAGFSLETNTLGIFLTNQRLILVTSSTCLDSDIASIAGASSLTALMLKIIATINQHFHQHLKVIHQALNDWEKGLSQQFDQQYFQHIYSLQKGLVFYINALDSNHKCIERVLINKNKFGFDAVCEDITDDLLLDTLQSYQQAKDYADILGGLSQTMAAIVNNQLNERIKKLTIISLCVMIPTLVVSLFSMNVDLPIPQHGTTQAFWLILAFAFLSVLTITWLWRTRRW